MDVPLVVALASFLTVVLAGTAVFLYLNTREAVQDWRRRAEGTQVDLDSGTAPTTLVDQLAAQLRVVLEWFGRLNRSSNSEEIQETRLRLMNAGYRSAKAPAIFLGTKLFLAIVAVAGFTMVPAKLLGFPTGTQLTIYYVVVAACGYYAPVYWLRKVIAARQNSLQRAIPDALDLLVVCVEAGLGLDQAVARVGDEVKRNHPALADELNVLSLELRTGAGRVDALKNLARRTDLEEVRNLVAILIQTDRFGTSIAQALRVHSDSMRTTRRLKAEELAAKLPIKLMIPLILFILPSLFIVVMGPACIQMVRVLFPILSGASAK